MRRRSGTARITHHVPPMLDGAKENMESIGQSPDYFKDTILTADSNYHSKDNLQKCVDEGVDAYIPDRDFRNRDPRFAGQERYGRKMRTHYGLEDFRYDKEKRSVCVPQREETEPEGKEASTDG